MFRSDTPPRTNRRHRDHRLASQVSHAPTAANGGWLSPALAGNKPETIQKQASPNELNPHKTSLSVPMNPLKNSIHVPQNKASLSQRENRTPPSIGLRIRQTAGPRWPHRVPVITHRTCTVRHHPCACLRAASATGTAVIVRAPPAASVSDSAHTQNSCRVSRCAARGRRLRTRGAARTRPICALTW